MAGRGRARRSRADPQLPAAADLAAVGPVELDDGTSFDGVVLGPDAVVPPHLRGVDLAASRLHGVRLTGCEIEQLRLTDVVLDDCELSGAVLAKAVLTRVRMERCRMSGTYLAEGQLTDVLVTDTKADGIDVRMTTAERVEWVECDLHDASFTAARLRAVRLLRCDLSGADVTGVRAQDVALHGSNLDRLKGAVALRGSVIASDQLVPLAVALLDGIGIAVDDGYLDDEDT